VSHTGLHHTSGGNGIFATAINDNGNAMAVAEMPLLADGSGYNYGLHC